MKQDIGVFMNLYGYNVLKGISELKIGDNYKNKITKKCNLNIGVVNNYIKKFRMLKLIEEEINGSKRIKYIKLTSRGEEVLRNLGVIVK